jgi:hypothetical protein
MAARHWQWRVSLFLRNAPLAVACFIIFSKRVTVNGAFASYMYKTRNALHLTCAGFERNTLPFVYLKFYGFHSYF